MRTKDSHQQKYIHLFQIICLDKDFFDLLDVWEGVLDLMETKR
ncbi:hypothetical protein pb186bvf_014614 [Paramecium bursaria]